MKWLACAQTIFWKDTHMENSGVAASGKENCVAEGALSLLALVPFEFCIMSLFSWF